MNSVPLPNPSLVTRVTHRAMATEFVVILPPHHADAVEPVVAALEELDEIESALTIYRENSEISRLNLLAADGPVRLSAETFSLIENAVRWSVRTSGAFDITAGPLVEAWGFTRRSGRKPSAQEIEQARRRVGYQHLLLDADRCTVQFARAGMSVNMGGIGKGDALDRVTSRLCADGLTDFLLHGGNSSVIARGDQTLGSEMGWAVGIAHPTKPKRRLGGIWLRDCAMGTSGSGKQFFHHRGRRYGHVIDPRTGYPAGDLLALTVLTASAADADACSTGFFVGGQFSIAAGQSSIAAGQSSTAAGMGSTAAEADWEMPAMIKIGAGKRQDGTELESCGEIAWVDQEEESFGQVSHDGVKS